MVSLKYIPNKETQKSATSHAPIKSSSLKERLTDFKNNPQKKSINEKRKRGGKMKERIRFTFLDQK